METIICSISMQFFESWYSITDLWGWAKKWFYNFRFRFIGICIKIKWTLWLRQTQSWICIHICFLCSLWKICLRHYKAWLVGWIYLIGWIGWCKSDYLIDVLSWHYPMFRLLSLKLRFLKNFSYECLSLIHEHILTILFPKLFDDMFGVSESQKCPPSTKMNLSLR